MHLTPIEHPRRQAPSSENGEGDTEHCVPLQYKIVAEQMDGKDQPSISSIASQLYWNC